MKQKVKIEIHLSEEILQKLKEQLASMKVAEASLPENNFPKINTIKELIEAYVEQLTKANDDFSNMKDKLEDVYEVFQQKGINLTEIFNSLYKTNETKTSSDKTKTPPQPEEPQKPKKS